MVWMHGAGFRAGHGNGTIENGIRLPQHGAVLVTINMRVAFIGLMAHPLLSRESPNCVSGNYMCLDMIAALEWIQKNIAAFGGDPANVTIFGESGGGSKVIALMCSPLAKGLFHQAIIESGGLGLISGTPLKVLESIGEKLFAKLGIDKEKDPLAAARTVSWEEIVETSDALGKELNIPIPLLYDITLDGWFLPDTPANIFRAGKQNAVPFIIGANLGELTNPGVLFPSRVTNFDEQLQKMVMQFREQIPNYILMFSGAKKAKVKGYAYIFDQVPSKWRQEGAVSCHAMDIPYVFGAYDEKGGFKHLLELAHLSVANSPDVGVTDVDRKVSEAMMTMWAQFAKTGNPSVKGLIKWPAYKAATDQYLYITEHLEVKSGFSTVGQK
jgi:para-nitrobenzyl esterase